jgi:DNA primase
MSIFEKIQDRISILEVIEEYTPVIDRGNYFVALCPFHKEKRPSMSINKEKGVYYCFGCMASGNIFTFVQNIENISKKDALEKLALKAGVTLDNYETNNELEDGYKLLNSISALFHEILKTFLTSENYISKYIAQRKLTTNTIEKFNLGYAPKGNFLINFLEKHNISKELALKVGLLTFKDGIYRDKFSDRLIIPIYNDQGKICGYTGRTLPNDISDRPKYLNSPDSLYFNKSKILFGLDKSKQDILANKKVILVEGNMDVITSYQNGLTYTIATQGTSTTIDHIKKIKRLNSSLILSFDNDNAGKTAELKVLKLALEQDINVFKLIIPNIYKDIDDYLKVVQIQDIEIKPYLEYLINTSQNLISQDLYIQKSAINNILNLTKEANPIIQAQAIQLIQNKSGLDISTLKKINVNKLENKILQPSIIYDPIKASFYQLLSLSSDHSNLKIIYNIIKDKLDNSKPTFEEYINQDEIKWIIESEKIKYQDTSVNTQQAIGNLVLTIKRLYNHDEIKNQLSKINFSTVSYNQV